MSIEGPWNVTFDTILGGPEKAVFEYLSDWSKNSAKEIKFYSGIAAYSKSFNLPDSVIKNNNSDIYLDLGIVRNIASVTLNGKDLGAIWTSPWQVNISDAVRNGNNHLIIEVANLWVNRLIGDESEPWDGIENGKWPEWIFSGTKRPTKRYTFATYRPYKKDDKLIESGLLGPVRLLETTRSSIQVKL